MNLLIFRDFSKFILDLFRFLKINKKLSFYRSLKWQLTRRHNDASPCDDVYTCHVAHNVHTCMCAHICARVYMSVISGLSIH